MKRKPVQNHYILWADDDADDIMMMRDVLETFENNHKVEEAHNGEEVLDFLHNLKDPSCYPCLIILDLNMPLMDGRETLKALKADQKYSSIPVVVFTTSHNELDRQYCKLYKVEMYTKPDSFTKYQDVLKKIICFCDSVVEQEKTADSR